MSPETTNPGAPSVTLNEGTKLDLKLVLILVGIVVTGMGSFFALRAETTAANVEQDARITAVESDLDTVKKAACAIARKLNVVVSDCEGGS